MYTSVKMLRFAQNLKLAFTKISVKNMIKTKIRDYSKNGFLLAHLVPTTFQTIIILFTAISL